jgi:hypothetical protein
MAATMIMAENELAIVPLVAEFSQQQLVVGLHRLRSSMT